MLTRRRLRDSSRGAPCAPFFPLRIYCHSTSSTHDLSHYTPKVMSCVEPHARRLDTYVLTHSTHCSVHTRPRHLRDGTLSIDTERLARGPDPDVLPDRSRHLPPIGLQGGRRWRGPQRAPPSSGKGIASAAPGETDLRARQAARGKSVTRHPASASAPPADGARPRSPR